MKKDLQVTIREGEFLDIDYNAVLQRLAILLLTSLSSAQRGFRLVKNQNPRPDGPFYQMQLIVDGEKVLFECEGDSEQECADSLWGAICERFTLIERQDKPCQGLH